jgi:hypothetical protein
MRRFHAFVIVAGLLPWCIEGLALSKRTDGPARVLGLPIQRREAPDLLTRDRLRRRAGTVLENLDNEVSLD